MNTQVYYEYGFTETKNLLMKKEDGMATSIWLHRRENYTKTKIIFTENHWMLAFPSHKTCKYIAFYKDQ